MSESLVYQNTVFRGLNLSSSPEDVLPGESTDCLNVFFDGEGNVARRGGMIPIGVGSGQRSVYVGALKDVSGVSSRYGEAAFFVDYNGGSAAARGEVYNLFADARARVYDRFCTVSDTQDCAVGEFPISGNMAYGYDNTSTVQKGYIAVSGQSMMSVDVSTAALSILGAAYPKPISVAAQPVTNALFACGFDGATDGPAGAASSGSHVYVSQDSDASTWDALDYEQLSPGDGETICAAAAWGENVFVFKQTKFFVFGRSSIDGRDKRRFNYNMVSGVGCGWYNAVAVAADGIYFASESGVYKTTGGPAQCVSEKISPLFSGFEASAYHWMSDKTIEKRQAATSAGKDGWGPARIGSNVSLFFLGDRLYLSDRAHGLCWVYDKAGGDWSCLSAPMPRDYTSTLPGLPQDNVVGNLYNPFFFPYEDRLMIMIREGIYVEDKNFWCDKVQSRNIAGAPERYNGDYISGQPVISWWQSGQIRAATGSEEHQKNIILTGSGQFGIALGGDFSTDFAVREVEFSGERPSEHDQMFLGYWQGRVLAEGDSQRSGEHSVFQYGFTSTTCGAPWKVSNIKILGAASDNNKKTAKSG